MEFIWWAVFKDTIGSADTFALATRGSEAVTRRRARPSPKLQEKSFGLALFTYENKNSGQRESNPHGQLGRLELYH
jgi:hypothetical protein